MFKRMIAIVLLVALCGCLLAACDKDEKKEITGMQAKQLVLDDLGVTEDQAEVHVHNGKSGEEPCYFVYVTYGDQNLQYVIRISDGKILSKGPGSHSH